MPDQRIVFPPTVLQSQTGGPMRLSSQPIRSFISGGVVFDVRKLKAGTGFETDHVDALLRQFVRQRAAASARTDDDDGRTVVDLKLPRHLLALGNQSITPAPR